MFDLSDAMFIFLAAIRAFSLARMATRQSNAAFSRTADAVGILVLVAFKFNDMFAIIHTPADQIVTFSVMEVARFVASQPLNVAAREGDLIDPDFAFAGARVSTLFWARVYVAPFDLAHARLETSDSLVQEV